MLKFLENQYSMTKPQYEEMIEKINQLNDLPNSQVVDMLDKLSLEFEFIKKNIIELTYYLDSLEINYNKVLEEYQKRNK